MKISFDKLNQFLLYSDNYLSQLDGKENKLSYAIKKLVAPVQMIIKKHNEDVQDITVRFAETREQNKKKFLIFDSQGRYTFTAEGERKKLDAIRKWNAEDRYEFSPFYATELPDDLTEMEIEGMTGFVIAEPKQESNGKLQDRVKEKGVAGGSE